MTKTISEEEQLGNYIKTANEFAESKKKSFGHFSDKWEWLITRIYLESKQAGQAQALKDFVSELKEHSHKVGNERVVTENTIERILREYIK